MIRPVEGKDFYAFKKLFAQYYEELDCDDDPLHLFDEYVVADLEAGLLKVAVAEEEGKLCGFIIYQVDDVINDWCFKEGCGDIREAYVLPDSRKKGVGKMLVCFAENDLDCKEIYTLPTPESERFFINCGYCDGGEYCPELDNKVFIKNL